MIKRYKIVKAKNYQDAIEKSGFYIGQPAIVAEIVPSANSDGTYTVMLEFDVTENSAGDSSRSKIDQSLAG